LLGLLLPADGARANGLVDAFFTPDQQGRWAFEHHHYPAAAAHFSDPYWKGIAAYNAADYDLALASFAQLDTAPAYFYLGNIYTRRFKFDQAIAAYTQALRLQPEFAEAQANLALARALEKDYESAQENAPDIKADKVVYDKPAGKGPSKQVEIPQAASDELWLQNLTTSPADFLRRKFSLQDQTVVRGTP
jgi:Ca-activated chloride channel family protein